MSLTGGGCCHKSMTLSSLIFQLPERISVSFGLILANATPTQTDASEHTATLHNQFQNSTDVPGCFGPHPSTPLLNIDSAVKIKKKKKTPSVDAGVCIKIYFLYWKTKSATDRISLVSLSGGYSENSVKIQYKYIQVQRRV